MILLRVDAAAGLMDTPLGPIPCAIGRNGIVAANVKREGDGATPCGSWPIRGALLRSDRGFASPSTALPWRWLRPADGWCDEPGDASYNRPVVNPHRGSAERLWRDDALYDVIIVLGQNDTPPLAGRGSAIFLHVRPESGSTEGCLAVPRDALLELLDLLAPGDMLTVA
ncbi:MAG: L,D-transpeptidase family protein [Sphingomonadaceae bacterium]|nr:L,D-transpeptidase family protein [Sphingomonadaceae bacterium]